MQCFKYLGSKITVDGRIEIEMKSRISDVGKVLRGMKKVFSCRTMAMNVKRRLDERVAGTETWSMAETQKKILNVMDMKHLRCMCGVTRNGPSEK